MFQVREQRSSGPDRMRNWIAAMMLEHARRLTRRALVAVMNDVRVSDEPITRLPRIRANPTRS